MKKFLKLMMILVVSITLFSSCAHERIDAGCVGIKVNLYGADKGVSDVTEVTGSFWYNSYFYSIYEFPTYNQRVIWTKSVTEGSKYNEEFTMTAKDGLAASFDVALNYQVAPTMVVNIFKNYRKPLDELNNTVIRDFVRKAFKTATEKYTAEELFSKAGAFQLDAERLCKEILEPKGFIINELSIVGKLRLPRSVEKGIEAKVMAKQKSLETAQEVETTRANADKAEANAKGKYNSAVWLRKADEERSKGLTDRILRQQEIEAWKAGGSKVPTNITVVGKGSNSPFILGLSK